MPNALTGAARAGEAAAAVKAVAALSVRKRRRCGSKVQAPENLMVQIWCQIDCTASGSRAELRAQLTRIQLTLLTLRARRIKRRLHNRLAGMKKIIKCEWRRPLSRTPVLRRVNAWHVDEGEKPRRIRTRDGFTRAPAEIVTEVAAGVAR